MQRVFVRVVESDDLHYRASVLIPWRRPIGKSKSRGRDLLENLQRFELKAAVDWKDVGA